MAYTNSSMVAYTKLSPNHSGQRTHSIDRITPHCVVGQCTAEGLGDWFAKSSTQASSNYGIDKDGRVGMYVEEKNRSWCSSSNANDQRAITIECASDTTEPYAFRDIVYQTLIKLCVDICKRNGKTKLLWLGDKDKTLAYEPKSGEMILTVHRWFANKSCPGNWMYARMGDLAEKVTAALGSGTNGKDGATTSQGTQASDFAGKSEEDVVKSVGTLFTADQKKTGILASVSMAQFILESGYGKSELAQNANNVFGMKYSLSGNVQEEIARRKELGPRANKSLNLTCFSGMLKCPYCGQSYMHSKRTDRGFMEFWVCGSRKKKGGRCPVGGSINHENLKKACATVLGLDEFDEDVFFDKVDHINVPERETLEFHLKSGEVITKDCPNTGHQDCWTAEYRAKTSEKRRKKPNCKGSSVMTGKIKCVGCGCNFRRATQPSSTAESGKAYYWRCAERDGCGTVGLREDVLKPFIAETLGITEFDDAEFEKQIDHIDVLSATEMVFHFKDGRTVSRTWEQPKRVGRPWTDEQRAKFKESIKGRYTPEVRQRMSEHMKQLRKERGKAWRKEK